jgi:hypothetical protein
VDRDSALGSAAHHQPQEQANHCQGGNPWCCAAGKSGPRRRANVKQVIFVVA